MPFVKTPGLVERLRQHDVSLSGCNLCVISAFGLLLWAAPLVTYVMGYVRVDDKWSTEGIVWMTNIVVHATTGVAVDVDLFFCGGTYWPLQMCIVGLATFVTFTIPALLGLYLATGDDEGVTISMTALALACFSNAAMVSILFELFHKGMIGRGVKEVGEVRLRTASPVDASFLDATRTNRAATREALAARKAQK